MIWEPTSAFFEIVYEIWTQLHSLEANCLFTTLFSASANLILKMLKITHPRVLLLLVLLFSSITLIEKKKSNLPPHLPRGYGKLSMLGVSWRNYVILKSSKIEYIWSDMHFKLFLSP